MRLLLAQIYYKTQQYDTLKELAAEALEKFPTVTPFAFY